MMEGGAEALCASIIAHEEVSHHPVSVLKTTGQFDVAATPPMKICVTKQLHRSLDIEGAGAGESSTQLHRLAVLPFRTTGWLDLLLTIQLDCEDARTGSATR